MRRGGLTGGGRSPTEVRLPRRAGFPQGVNVVWGSERLGAASDSFDMQPDEDGSGWPLSCLAA